MCSYNWNIGTPLALQLRHFFVITPFPHIYFSFHISSVCRYELALGVSSYVTWRIQLRHLAYAVTPLGVCNYATWRMQLRHYAYAAKPLGICSYAPWHMQLRHYAYVIVVIDIVDC